MSNLAYDAFAGIAAAQAVYSATQDSPYKAQFFNAATGDSLIIFDVQKTETYKHSSKLTRFPVEKGADLSDHQIFQPDEIEIEALVTDTPFNADALLNSFLNTAVGAVAGPLGVIATTAASNLLGYSSNSEASRSITSYDLIRDLIWRAGVAVHVQTKLGLFEFMMIENVTVPRDSTISDGLIFNISLVTVNIAEGQEVSSTDMATPSASMGHSNVGSQAAEKTPSAIFANGFHTGDIEAFNHATQLTGG